MRWIILLSFLIFLVPFVLAVTGDINSDGTVDILDLVSAVNCMNGQCNGLEDLNGDGVVDILDLVIIVNNFGNSGPLCTPSQEVCNGVDDDCDGQVDEGNVCGSQDVCGDNVCNGVETCSSCSQDCGQCPPPPPTSSQHFLGDFSTCTSDTQLHALAGTTTKNNVHCEKGIGMRYDFIARPTHCNDHSLASIVSLPSGTKEIWIRFRIRFSNNWDTENPNCSSPAEDYKTVLAWLNGNQNPPDGGVRRFDYKTRKSNVHASGPGYASADVVPVSVVRASGHPGSDQLFWDGQWHTVELHFKVVSDNETLVQAKVDGLVTHNYRTKTSSGLASRWLSRINIGANRNVGATELMHVWWDDFQIWTDQTGAPASGFSFPVPTVY